MTEIGTKLARIPIDAVRLDDISRRFVQVAEHRRLVDLAFDVVASPIGNLILTCTYKGVARIDFGEGREDQVLDRIAEELSPRLMRVPARTDQARRELDEYFSGSRRRFEVPVDLSSVQGFRRKILAAAKKIPYGRTASYTQMAAAAGNPRAVRAAGTALGKNPVPIIVPCHRVLRSDGTLGGYGGGLPKKELLLELEGGANG